MCLICGKCFTIKRNLDAHSLLHSDNKPYRCMMCPASFTCNIYDDYNIKQFSSNNILNAYSFQSFKTPRNQTFWREKIPLSALWTSLQIKRYKRLPCEVSTYWFTALHMYCMSKKILSGQSSQKSYVESYKRAKVFLIKNIANLYFVLLFFRHQCTMCNKTFMQKRHLTAHMNSHLGQRPYGCMVCGRMFSHSGSLSTHLKTHKKTILL